jgi:signal transduction histidine kinase
VSSDHERLQQGFEQFIAAARELEQSYDELKQRTAAVDLELQATNRALQASLREREAIFAALPIGLVAVRDGDMSCCNREGERILAAATAVGVDLARRLPGECTFGDMLVRLRRVELPDGELVVLEDRSRVQELEREVHRLDRLAGLSELALGIAHEIKNPLNGVMGFAALLERGNDPTTMRRHAGKVVQGVRQVDEIVRSLLRFARPDRGQARLASVAEVIAEAAAAAGVPNGRLQLRGELDVSVDADALVRVLANLFQNAVEAAPEAMLQVDAATGNGRLELLVQDDGPGVAHDLGQRAFEPFVSTKERGTGLGLPLSARVLSFLGGDLELCNPGQPGARFRVRLPLRQVERTEAAAEVAS